MINLKPLIPPAAAPAAAPCGVVSLAGIRSNEAADGLEPWNRPAPVPEAPPAAKPRICHPGGKMRSNKNEALLLFLKRKQHKGENLTDEQLAALAVAADEASASSSSPATAQPPTDMLAKLEQKVAAGIESRPLLRQEKGRVAVVPAVVKKEQRQAAKQRRQQQQQQQQQHKQQSLGGKSKKHGMLGRIGGKGAGGRGGHGHANGRGGGSVTGQKRRAEQRRPALAKKAKPQGSATGLVAKLNSGLGCGR